MPIDTTIVSDTLVTDNSNVLQRPQFLTKCLVKRGVVKAHRDRHTSYVYWVGWKPVEAYYIGYRLVHEGVLETDSEYDDYGNEWSSIQNFTRTSSFIVYQFVINERRNIILAKPEDVEIVAVQS